MYAIKTKTAIPGSIINFFISETLIPPDFEKNFVGSEIKEKLIINITKGIIINVNQ
jgi:hypothetical protein